MNNRSCYSEFEDVRMLKWVARKEGSEAPLGIALWQSYTDTYNSGHTPQSLNGRMRRQIIPNLYNYVRYLKTSDLASLYVMFSQRLDPDDRRRIKKYITRAREMRKERENQKNEDGDTTNMRSVSVQPHPERRQSIAKEKPTDDRDVFKRKTIGGEDSRSRLDSDGPSTSAAPPQSSKRRVIGEVSSTAEIHSDDDDSVVQKKNTRSVEKPDEEIQVISRNAVEVVSSTASFETTPSGKLEKNYNKSTNKNNSTVRSDGEEDEVVSTPKAKNQYSFDLDEDEDFLEPSYRKEDWSSKKKSNLRMQFSDDSDVDDLYVSSKITPMKVASTSTWHEQERLVIIEEADGEEEIADDDDYVSPATTPTQKTVPETTSYFGFADDDDEDYEEPLNRVQAATIVAEVIVLDEDVTDPDPDPVVPEKKSPEKAQKLDEDSEKTPKKTNMTVEIEKEVKETSEKTLKISKKTPEIEKIAREKSEKSLKISKKTAEIEKEVMETSEKSLKKSKKTAEIEKTVKETSGKTLKISKKTAEIEKEVEKEAEKDDEEEDLLQKKSKKSKKPLDEEKTLKKSKKPTLEEEEEAPSTSKKSNKHIEEEIDSKKKKSKKPEEEYIEKKSKKSKESAQEEDEKRPKRAADEMEAAVKISPPKKVARRTSSERDDAAEMSEVDKAVLEFSSHKKSKHKRKPTSPQKALPVESEDDDLADRIMATIKEREDAQRTAEANASSMQGEGEPARDEDLLKTPNDSRYVACRDLAPKDDRIDYHWVLDKSGRRRWIQKPKNMRQCSDPNSSSKSPRKKRRKMGFANRPKRRRRSRKSENKCPDPGEEKGEEEEEKEEEEEEDLVTQDIEQELDKDAEGEEQLEEDDCVEEHHEQQVEDSPKRTHTTSSAQDDVDIDDDLFYYTIDKLGRRRKWRKTMTSDANPSRAQLAGRALVETPKKRRGRPPRVKPPPEVEKTPEHDYLPGTSSRIPPVELETSTASTLPDANKEDRVFSFQQWNVDMRPVAENAIRQMYEHMFQHLEGRSVTEEELREVVEGDNVQQLLDKMFKEDEQQGEEDFVIVGVETFSAKKLRFRYFVRIQDELKRHTATPHVRSAVLTFFQYFEYTVAATVTGKNFDTYTTLMDQLIKVSFTLATF